MLRQKNPLALVFMGLLLTLGGLSTGLALHEAPSGPVHARSSVRSSRGNPPLNKQQPVYRVLVILAAAATLGGPAMIVYGLVRLRRRMDLLAQGVAVIGQVTWIHTAHKRPHRIHYRFRDEAGYPHQGIHEALRALPLPKKLEVGADVTVVYDPSDPSRHALDVNDTRRAHRG